MSIPKWKKIHMVVEGLTVCKLDPKDVLATEKRDETSCMNCIKELQRADDMASGEKVCSGCKEKKSRDLFDVNKLAVDGRHCYCKHCRKIRNAQKWIEKKSKVQGGEPQT